MTLSAKPALGAVALVFPPPRRAGPDCSHFIDRQYGSLGRLRLADVGAAGLIRARQIRGLGRLGCGQRSAAFLDKTLKARKVLQKAIAGQTKKVVSEFRIVQIDLTQPVVANSQDLAILDALDRLRPVVAGRDKAEFAQDAPGGNFDTNFGHQEFSRHRQEHFRGGVAFVKQHVALLVGSCRHEWPQPVQRQIAPSRASRLFDQVADLEQPDEVDRQRQQIEKELRDRAASAAAARKKTPLMMHSTRSGTIVRTTNVRIKNIPPARNSTFANVILARTMSSRRLNIAS